jgi:hypothetical protein
MPPDGLSQAKATQGNRGHKGLDREGYHLIRRVESREIAGERGAFAEFRGGAAFEKIVQQRGARGPEQDQHREVHQERRLAKCVARGLPDGLYLALGPEVL